jgi:hypothetical protein
MSSLLHMLPIAFVFSVSVAHASPRALDGMVVAARDRDALAVSLRAGTWVSYDGAPFGPLDVPAEEDIIDMLFDTDGALVLASKPEVEAERRSRIVVRRYEPQSGAWARLAKVPGYDAMLGYAGAHLVVISDDGAWSLPSGVVRAVQLARWNLRDFDSASIRETPRGAIELLLPRFYVPCEGPVSLKGMDRILITPQLEATHAHASTGLSAGEDYFVRTRDGTVYSTGELYYGEPPTTCQLRVSVPPAYDTRLLTRPAMRNDDCRLDFGALGDRAVLGLGDKVFSLADGGATELGALEAAEVIASASPDRQGRALILLRDGRLFRYAPGTPRELLWQAPED